MPSDVLQELSRPPANLHNFSIYQIHYVHLNLLPLSEVLQLSPAITLPLIPYYLVTNHCQQVNNSSKVKYNGARSLNDIVAELSTSVMSLDSIGK